MAIRIANLVFDAPGAPSELYAAGAGGSAKLYAALLGMRLRSRAEVHREAGYEADDGDEIDPLVMSDDRSRPGIAFEYEPGEYRAPRWPDSEHPQQVHLDVVVRDVEEAHRFVLQHGATLLRQAGGHRVYADPVGHPFCLYPEGAGPNGQIARIVFDCFSPRALGAFYAELLDMPLRALDTPARVEIGRADRGLPMLAFQHVQGPAPRWPDPAYPQQVHVDFDPDEPDAARDLAERLGAIRLPHLGGGSAVYADPAGHPFCLGE